MFLTNTPLFCSPSFLLRQPGYAGVGGRRDSSEHAVYYLLLLLLLLWRAIFRPLALFLLLLLADENLFLLLLLFLLAFTISGQNGSRIGSRDFLRALLVRVWPAGGGRRTRRCLFPATQPSARLARQTCHGREVLAPRRVRPAVGPGWQAAVAEGRRCNIHLWYRRVLAVAVSTGVLAV